MSERDDFVSVAVLSPVAVCIPETVRGGRKMEIEQRVNYMRPGRKSFEFLSRISKMQSCL